MYSVIDDLILYRDLKFEDTIRAFCTLNKGCSDISKTVSGLLEVAGEYGLDGNLWENILALALAYNENVYSKATEIIGETTGSINTFALHDFKIFRKLFHFTPNIDNILLKAIFEYVGNGKDSKLVNTRVRDRILKLSRQLSNTDSDEEFKNTVTEFYKEYGVGKFGLNKAFRIEESTDLNSANIIPITRVEHVYLKDIIGYDIQKKKLINNTESFIKGKPANNCLLYGDAGTGKSSSVKAIVNEYYEKGLRIIEIYKHQFRYLSDILEQLKDRNYKFIIYMDDLSFEESELEYKYLEIRLKLMKSFTVVIQWKKNFHFPPDSVKKSTMAHRIRRSLTGLYFHLLKSMALIWMRKKFLQRQICGSSHMAVCREEVQHSL